MAVPYHKNSWIAGYEIYNSLVPSMVIIWYNEFVWSLPSRWKEIFFKESNQFYIFYPQHIFPWCTGHKIYISLTYRC